MNWFIKAVFLTIIASLAVILVTRFVPAIPISSVITQKDSSFDVSGQGKVTVVPDTAILNLGVTTQGSTVKQVQSQTNTSVNSITEKLKSMGVDSKDIKTTNYSISPNYDYTQSNRNQITGYNISVNLTVKVRNLDQLNDVIDQATALGANTLGGISFTVADDRLKELQKQARVEAIADAKQKASDLASASGLTLGRLINVTESSPIIASPMYRSLSLAPGSAESSSSTDIQTGSTDITSSVTLSYEVR